MLKRLTSLVCLIGMSQAAHAACKVTRAESDVAGIRLVDEASSARVLGPRQALATEQPKTASGADADFPFVRIRSADGRQDAKLFEHNGATAGAYSEIEVRPADLGKNAATQVASAELATERGITLGMREADLVRRLGSCFRREHGNGSEVVIIYRITDAGHALLRRTGYESYFARYAFKAGRLVWFRFGFDPV